MSALKTRVRDAGDNLRKEIVGLLAGKSLGGKEVTSAVESLVDACEGGLKTIAAREMEEESVCRREKKKVLKDIAAKIAADVLPVYKSKEEIYKEVPPWTVERVSLKGVWNDPEKFEFDEIAILRGDTSDRTWRGGFDVIVAANGVSVCNLKMRVKLRESYDIEEQHEDDIYKVFVETELVNLRFTCEPTGSTFPGSPENHAFIVLYTSAATDKDEMLSSIADIISKENDTFAHFWSFVQARM